MSRELIKDLIIKLNEENYHNFIEAASKEDLANEMYKYLLENNLIEENEVTIKDVESYINWKGEGMYVLVGWNFGCKNIEKIETIFDTEIDTIDFPFSFSSQAITDFEVWVKNIKKDEGYKYIYFVCHNKHVVVPNEYRLDYIVKSNHKIDDVIEYLKDKENIFVGEFETLGANYFVEELADFDVSEVSQYDFSNYFTIDIE